LSAAYRRKRDGHTDSGKDPDNDLGEYASARGASQARAMSISLALAVVLALAGYGAARAAELLEFAMRTSGPIDVATVACAAYQSQRYQLLTQEIDPAPSPPRVTGAFNPAAIETQLRALDKLQGIVQHCDVGRFSGGDPIAQYTLTLQRARAPLPATIVLVLRHETDGAWKISRATNFSGSSA
jgi:hypothetical protein